MGSLKRHEGTETTNGPCPLACPPGPFGACRACKRPYALRRPGAVPIP
ncbi:hypothetical protein HMPREF6745_0019 [Prevotella sp. oral taxon 472 str. F0295]|nr:hypothetical protein HMPREF6745_0019 [Prevotella sp. oral taxon 472 str. F0295]